ncbi:gliding motility lipoprotein GldB [Altibacter sp.]|uniref:gliding motility lipoprotein GldB n=1 Tax=Altibacter sp. TaxID=2024823 RepID=UPI0025BC5C5C|nr:gliding motility lipoprotein GldB [Altibacter sp.]
MMKYFIFIALAMPFLACETKSEKADEIEKIPVDLTIVRFDKTFANASVADLPSLKATYPLFFPEQYADSIWVQRMQDTLQQQLHSEVVQRFPDNSVLEDDLTPLFQHIKYYFPQFETPKVYTTTSDVDYRNKVIATDSLLIIALDTYLGEAHPFYEGIQRYTVKNMKPSQIPVDVAEAYAQRYVAPPRDRSLLSFMIYYGKILYLKDLWLPKVSNAEKLGYTEAEYQWVEDNEVDMWRYFVENELLYSTDPKLPPRFINPAPFSKFYLEIDNESPGMTGRYLGWQIVASYMENNAASLQQLSILEAEEIFKNSKYKPKKN